MEIGTEAVLTEVGSQINARTACFDTLGWQLTRLSALSDWASIISHTYVQSSTIKILLDSVAYRYQNKHGNPQDMIPSIERRLYFKDVSRRRLPRSPPKRPVSG